MAQFWTTARLTRIIIKASATLFATGLAGSVWYGGPMTTRVDAADLLAQSGGLAAPATHGRPDPRGAAPQLAGGPGVPVEQVVEVQRGDTLMELLIDAGVRRNEAHDAIVALEEVFPPRELMPGQEIRLNLTLEPAQFVSQATPLRQGLMATRRRKASRSPVRWQPRPA